MKKADLNILIVDDDKSQRESLSEAVKRRGFRPIAVAKPDEAISIVKIKPIHGALVDCMLPGKNGLDLVDAMKENLLDGAAIVLMSGIYRDKGYAQDAVKRTGAIEFFHKPFNVNLVLDLFEKATAGFLQAEKVDLHKLLTSPFASHRERRKSLDHLEELSGYDIPFVFCILMESESSGHLNLVDTQQNIFGVTFAKGQLVKIDSESTQLTTKKILISQGFITEGDLGELSNNSKSGELSKLLVDEGLMSPHAVALVKLQTAEAEFKKLISPNSYKINFVPDRKIVGTSDDITLNGLFPKLYQFIAHDIPLEWFKKFYSVWQDHAIRPGPQKADFESLGHLGLFKNIKDVRSVFTEGLTPVEILSKKMFSEHDFYRVLHVLTLRRIVVFDEAAKTKGFDDIMSRVKTLHAAVVGQDPEKVLMYFGVPAGMKLTEIQRVYKDFVKFNHPDHLPPSIDPQIRKMANEIFSVVSAAHDIFSDEKKKLEFLNGKKQKEAVVQMAIEEAVHNARAQLKVGHFTEAAKSLEASKLVGKSPQVDLLYHWARLKMPNGREPQLVKAILKSLSEIDEITRAGVMYTFVMGLARFNMGDNEGAFECLKETLEKDINFMEARREYTAIKATLPVKMSAENILTGDITAVLTNIFKSKKKGA
jgi:ActR/RegA family two-component response regulator/curved DNA-binding protein CbpA